MKKKNGFIATSLIYSFFLVFIAIIAALINSYISNKTIQDRYNEEVLTKLNNDTYSVTVRTTNASILGGVTMTNIAMNGNFSNGTNFWNKAGSATYTRLANYVGRSALQKNNVNVSASYMYQNLNLLKNNTYYYSVDYINPSGSTALYSYIDGAASANRIQMNAGTSSWTHGSNTYKSTADQTKRFILGTSFGTYYNKSSYFSNVLVINLSASFGMDEEPSKEWVDKNVEYFTGTIGFIQKNKIKSGESISVRISPYGGYTCNINNVSCSGSAVKNSLNSKRIDSVNYYDFVLSSIKSDVTCNVVCR